ncbi:hypothetical protein BD779DRAFT_1669637 [Infundibulicybe gibba]|nr:hypothetical protein BD779DRAFT_1669637 [Infundibulicybe gibba]
MSNYCDYPAAGERDTLSRSPLRRLPPVPSPGSSRPLPPIPQALACKRCYMCITSHNVLLPQGLIPPHSRSFRGFSGKASLFTETYNVKLSRPAVQLMVTGAHTMQEITCVACSAYLGWKIVRAHDLSERWKEGHCLLELESLTTLVDPPLVYPRNRLSSGSGSDYSC